MYLASLSEANAALGVIRGVVLDRRQCRGKSTNGYANRALGVGAAEGRC